jgi:dihydroxyacetone kinase DhaKLM complex PTS-EIIA-like component DhaM
MTRLGIVLVTHVTEISEGLVKLCERSQKMLTSQLERS